MRIQIEQGSVSESDVREKHLVSNHLNNPDAGLDEMIMYAEKRYLMTLLVSGASTGNDTRYGYTPKGGDTIKSKISPIPKGELIDGNAYKFRIMGRIQKESVIVGNAAVGTPTAGSSSAGGFFKLHLEDNYLTNAMNALFPNGKQARVMGVPKRVGNKKYLYTFQSYPGDVFDFDTWFASQRGTKTIFGGYTTFGERSKRGYGNFHYPDSYIQHTTKQRKSFSISGDADSNKVRWYRLGEIEGFVFEAERQLRAQMLLEDETQKWWGKSTMKDSFGNLLEVPSMYDEYGEPIVAGDGWFELCKGSNDLETSGANGEAIHDDFVEMVTRIKKKRDYDATEPIPVITGADGMATLRKIANQEAQDSNIQYNVNLGDNQKLGGVDVPVGFNFSRLNIAGEQILAVENHQWNDEKKYPGKLANGKSIMGSTFFFIDRGMNDDGIQNMEIKARGREGMNRDLVYSWFPGMTGKNNKPLTPVDGDEFHIFKENMLVCRNIKSSGILSPAGYTLG